MSTQRHTEIGAALQVRRQRGSATKGIPEERHKPSLFNLQIMDDNLLTRVELARRWKVSIETLKRRERAKILRPVRLDERLIRYRMSDIVRIEKEGYDGGEG